MREVVRQLLVVGLSCVITLILWLGLRKILLESQSGISTSMTYVVVLVIYLIIRQAVEMVVARLGLKRQKKYF